MKTTNENLITAAINLNLIDTTDLIAMVIEHAGDVDALINELDEIADCNRHCLPVLRANWIAVRDAFAFLATDSPNASDEFGFRAGQRAAASSALCLAGL